MNKSRRASGRTNLLSISRAADGTSVRGRRLASVISICHGCCIASQGEAATLTSKEQRRTHMHDPLICREPHLEMIGIQMDTGVAKENIRENMFADLVRSLKKSSVIPLSPRAKRVHFSNEDDLIKYEVTSQDIKNSWYTQNIPRSLLNLNRIATIRGLRVSYPKSVHQGKECMVQKLC